jgi:DNA transformation protein
MVYRPLRYEQMMRAAEAHDVRARRMFGGMGVYSGEKMFAFLMEDEIGLKLSPDDYAEAMALEGAGPIHPEPNAEPMREYCKMPKTITNDYEAFVVWVERSINYVRKRTSSSTGSSAAL